MNHLLEKLEHLEITKNCSPQDIWSEGINLIKNTMVPPLPDMDTPPYEENYREFRDIVDINLKNIKSILQHIIYLRDREEAQIDYCSPLVNTFGIKLILLIGEQYEKSSWNTDESVSIARELISIFCHLYKHENISQYLMEHDNFKKLLETIRYKLSDNKWKTYPSSLICFKWILQQMEKPILFDCISEVVPTTLYILDDYMPHNILIGLDCSYAIIQHSYMKKGFVDNGYAHMMYLSLKRFTYSGEISYIVTLYSCISNLLTTIECCTTLNVFKWTMRDEILATLLDNMELEQNVELRHAYMQALPLLINNIGCAKWSERIIRVLSRYFEHHTELRTLKITLETTKRFLIMFHVHVPAHCVSLYTSFVKVYFDLSETPVFDKEIMQHLEDCICLLYKLTPDVGCEIMRDERIQSVIKNSLQSICEIDIKYFQ